MFVILPMESLESVCIWVGMGQQYHMTCVYSLSDLIHHMYVLLAAVVWLYLFIIEKNGSDANIAAIA